MYSSSSVGSYSAGPRFGTLATRQRIYASAVFQKDVQDGRVNRPLLTPQELKMYEIMDQVTDQEGWEDKVCNEQTVATWKNEILDLESDHITDDVADFIFKDLQTKAKMLQDSSIRGSVMIIPGSVVKSDRVLSDELRMGMKLLAEPLEDLPMAERDYRSDSAERVVYLVNPSLFTCQPAGGLSLGAHDPPLGLDDCFERLNEGQTGGSLSSDGWLPCEVKFEEGNARIKSYINNLHPIRHRQLYHLIEQVIDSAIPAWNLVLGSPIPKAPDEAPNYEESESSGKQAQKPPALDHNTNIDLLQRYEASGLQVIVELTNVELTFSKWEFMGDIWHSSGTEAERICATAHYFYDCDNITEPRIAFRQRSRTAVSTPGSDTGITTQLIGEVDATPGRLVAFPNTLQSRLQEFKLKDRSKRGTLRMLTIYLVDPGDKSTSSARVFPLQKDWWIERAQELDISGRLGEPGNELLAEMMDNLLEEDKPYASSKDSFAMTLGEVKYAAKGRAEGRREKEFRLAYFFETGRKMERNIEDSSPLPAYSA